MQETPAALLDQLAYFDNFLLNEDTPSTDLDAQVSLDLAAFADDAFVFADEEKPEPRDMSDTDGENTSGPGANPDEQRHSQEIHGASQDTSGPNDPTDATSGDLSEATLDLLHRLGLASALHADPWLQQGPQSPSHRGAMDASEGKQLQSLLNSKIETTKRNKLQHLVSHSSASPRMQGQGYQHTSLQHPRPHGGPQDMHYNALSLRHELPPANPRGLNEDLPHTIGSETAPGTIPDLTTLPKYPVPPGAKSSLKNAGLSQNQIDLLSALIAQHQSALKTEPASGLPGSSSRDHGMIARPGVPTLASSLSHAHSQGQSDIYGTTGLNNPLVAGSLLLASPSSAYGSETSTGSFCQGTYNEKNNEAGPGTSVDTSKRKRNTAASARFRVKKKLKEKEMETKIQQLGDMIQSFEMRIGDLEVENQFLKNLVIEKGNRDSDEELRLLRDRARQGDSLNSEKPQ